MNGFFRIVIRLVKENKMSKMIQKSILLAVAISLGLAVLYAGGIPKPLKSRFVTGDAVWRELPVREDLQTQYDRCWQTVINTVLENNFDIATMDKESGYVRTTWNEGVVTLGGSWSYKVQISIKAAKAFGDPKANPPTADTVPKVRVQVAGEIAENSRGRLVSFFRGYDQVLLQNLFQDLQAKLGSR
jgi:hypothetical protein